MNIRSMSASPGYSFRKLFRRFRIGGKSLALRSLPSDELSRLTQVLPASPQLTLCRPGLKHGPVPIKRDSADSRSSIDRLFLRWLSNRHHFGLGQTREWTDNLITSIESIKNLTDENRQSDLADVVQKLRLNHRSENLLDTALAHSCVIAEEAIGLNARPNQMMAARLMLRGVSVEMATGEGKTFAIALAAGVVALTGTPLHILTANDYLAQRDAANLEAYYKVLGLTVSSALSTMDADQRRESYLADIVYVTGKQVAFDWLNDAMISGASVESLSTRISDLAHPTTTKKQNRMLRGLCMAIVDEADSLLIDEARTPLVLAAAQHVNSIDDTEATIALGLAEQLMEGVHYTVDFRKRTVSLSEEGKVVLKTLADKVSQIWKSSRFRDERVEQALTALRLFKIDRDYIVRDGAVELLDAHTGRAMPDRRLQFGLHQLLEVKERCAATPDHTTIASIPFQHFFNRYIDIVGISGTLMEVQSEIHHIYGLDVVAVPSHKPSARFDLPVMITGDKADQLAAAISDIKIKHETGQPVLVCTRSVELSDEVSLLLNDAGLEHRVLNAYQDAEEAEIVANAGRIGQITVATNMAGRGTDIPLCDASVEQGGLHVLNLGFNDARRIDRQLLGRSARQGDPGSTQTLLSVDDPFLKEAMAPVVWRASRRLTVLGRKTIALKLIQLTQRWIERTHRRERVSMYKSKKKIDRYLAFGGQQEHLL